MNHSILKNCLNNEFFEANKEKLRAELFEDQLKELFNTITELQEKFNKDITALELFTYWKSKNPTSTTSWTEEMGDQIKEIADEKPSSATSTTTNSSTFSSFSA